MSDLPTPYTKGAEGWAFPTLGARKCHFFTADSRSLCGKYALIAPPPSRVMYMEAEGAYPSEDDCAACRKKLNARSAQLPQVLMDVTMERQRQIDKGWTPDHDDGHHTFDMLNLARQRISGVSPALTTAVRRRCLIQAIAILVAAVESIDRKEEARRG